MNKFDTMMRHLKRKTKMKHRMVAIKRDFHQVVAIDSTIEIVERIWCVSELYEAHVSKLPQKFKILSHENLKDNREKVQNIDVEKAQASDPRDKAMVLSKVKNPAEFNAKVAGLLCQQVDVMLSTAYVRGAVSGILHATAA